MRKFILVSVLLAVSLMLTGCRNNKVVAPPPEPYVPSNLNATAISSEEIELTWDDNSVDEKGFYVYRKDNGDYRRIVTLDANTTFYEDSNLDPQTTYWYLVSSYNDGGESELSNEAVATTMVEVEMLDYWMEKEYWDWKDDWYTEIKGEVKINTNQILTIRIAGEFYSYDGKWIAMGYYTLYDVNAGRRRQFRISHQGKTEIKYVKAWIEEYY